MSQNKSSGGIGILGVIEVLLILLKIIGVEPVASWAWSVVLIPIWIELGIIALFVICAIIVALFDN